ncbi:chemotaxis protein CheW [Pleurocapsales cyanobacterium LEGE 10410]|nr:chemotaxis protein CheW [Pleurocapsales cyanobacterium LEGE 10410]
MSNLIVDPNSRTISAQKNLSIKLLVFEIGKLTLALPILQVQKVVKHQDIHGSGLSHVNLAHLAQQELAVVDLHRKLFKVSLAEASPTKGYFIISKNITGEPLGIMVTKPPTIIDVSLEKIRQLPDAYRRADTLEIASHVAVVPQGETSLTIFILDLARLV